MEHAEPLTDADPKPKQRQEEDIKQATMDLSVSTDLAVQYVIFPRKGGWLSFPYPDIVALFAAQEGTILYVSSRTAEEEELPKSIQVISLSEAEKRLQEPHTVAIVAHPYWLIAVASLQPELCIALLPEPVGDEAASPLWESNISRLVGIADLVATSSETRYMKLLFQGTRAIWLGEKTLHQPVTFIMMVHVFHCAIMRYFYACTSAGTDW